MPRRRGYVRPRGPGCAPDQQDAAQSSAYEQRKCQPPDPVPLAQFSYHRPECIPQLGPHADRSGQLPDRSRGRPARIVFLDQGPGVDADRACYLANLASGEEVDPGCRVVVMLEVLDEPLPDAGPLTDIRDAQARIASRPGQRLADAQTANLPSPHAPLPAGLQRRQGQARTRGAMTAPLRPRYLGLTNRGEPGTRGGGLPERPGMSRENRGFRPQATTVASKAGRSSADEPAGCGRTRRRDFAPLMPTVICSGHCFELVERLVDKLRPVSLARLAWPVFDRDPEDSDPRHGRLRHGCADLCRRNRQPLGRRVAPFFPPPAGGPPALPRPGPL